MYNVKLEKFEGPMSLLLELIEKEKLDISELSLSLVADQYLQYLKNNDKIELEHLTEFLSVAAKLILIKSRSLLPMLRFSEEEEEEIKDLAFQLEEYKKFKEAAAKIGSLAQRRNIIFSRPPFSGAKEVFSPPENINTYDLKKTFTRILLEIPVLEKLEQEIVEEVLTLEERISHLETVIRKKVEISFSDLVAKANDKVEIIVSFLAMLEMIKQRIVSVEQSELFSEIKLKIKKD
jgi:segregation and condensation protein A